MRTLLISCFLCFSAHCLAQKFEPTSINLTVLDGLASNNVYCAMQDDQGYIWFGTETGVSRYNGREFENFYMSDGLADNEIFRIDQDSQGRIWFSALNGKLSYYFDGQFHNGKTDPYLATISPKSFYLNLFEDANGNVWLNTKKEVMVIQTSGEVKYFGNERYKTNSVTGFFEDDHHVWGVSIHSGNLIEFAQDNSISNSLKIQPIEDLKEVVNAYLLSRATHLLGAGGKTETQLLENEYSALRKMNLKATKVHSYPEGMKWICTYNGVIKIESLDGESQQFFEDDIVTHVLADREGGFWFTFLGKGVAYVPSLKNKSLRLAKNTSSDYVSTLMKDGETIWFGGSEGQLGKIQGDKVQLNHLFETNQRSMIKGIIKGTNPGELWVAAETRLVRTNGLKPIDDAHTSAKVIRRWGEDKYALGLSGYFIIMSKQQIYHDMETRTSDEGAGKIFEMSHESALHFDSNAGFVFDIENYNNGLLVSTSRELFFMDQDLNYSPVDGPEPIKERINDIMAFDSSTYALATHGYGTYLWMDEEWRHFSKAMGLNSDICRKVIRVEEGTFWIATNKGINRVKLNGESVEVSSLTKADGLLSEEVYDLVISNNNLVAATSDGISIIDIEAWEASKGQPVIIDPVLFIGDIPVVDQDPLLKHNAQNIKFHFDGIHFKSLDRLSYEYRLIGQGDEWKVSKQNSVNFGNLSAGDYTFQVRAISAFGTPGAIAQVTFAVELPIWKNWWVIVLVASLFVGLVLWVAYKFVLSNQRKSQRELEFKLRIADAERKALQSQLNPHFIFNSLNSIQCMVLEKKPEEAYGYLEKFSKLIRRVLQFSDLSMISIGEELETLKLYMDLERVRLEGGFEYSIELDDQVGSGKLIPAMIIQPYVENAIWHGIMPLNGTRQGLIEIEVTEEGDELMIVVSDNGVGRDPEEQPEGYGAKLAEQLANTHLTTGHSSVSIEDMSLDGQPTGTRVIIKFLTKELIYD